MLEQIVAWTRWRGRLRRRAFVLRGLVASAAFVVLFVFLERVAGHAGTLVLYPPFFLVLGSLASRRLHDQARSALWLLLLIVPILGPLLLAWWLLIVRGTAGDNEHGPDTLLAGRDYLQVAIHEPA